MNTMLVVLVAEFLRRVRSRAFIAGTVLGAASIIVLSSLPSLFGAMASGSNDRILLVGDPALTANAAPLLREFHITGTLTHLDAPPTAAFLDAHGKAAAAAVLLRRGGELRVVAYARDPSAFRSAFARDLAPMQVALATGAPVQRVAQHSKVPVEIHDVSGRFADVRAADAAKGIAYLFVMLLYVSILLNAQSIMSSVAEEKTSRIAELLVSTLDPSWLLTAKIGAAVATGLIQLAVWIATGMVAGRELTTVFSQGDAPGAAQMVGSFSVSPGAIVACVAFFVVGFAQYGVMYAAGASLINRTEDLGSISGPLVLPVIAGIIIAQIGLQFPTATNIVILSFVPLLSPFIMFTRIVVSDVPAWQIVLALAINIGAAAILAWLAGKVYRVGLLLYGRPPSLRQILATLRT